MLALERDRFQSFRGGFAARSDVRTALEQAVLEACQQYDTKIRENRFVVGGVVELVVGAALRACGVLVRHRGLLQTDVDLIFENAPGGYSVKGMFKTDRTNLLNVLGKKPEVTRWNTGTLFIVGDGVGIVYSDAGLPWWQAHTAECIKPTPGALSVTRRCVVNFARAHPDWVAPCDLPGKKIPQSSRSLKAASTDVAAQILMHHKVLFEHFAGLGPGQQK